MKQLLLVLVTAVLALAMAAAAYAYDDGAGGGSEQITCEYMPFPNPHYDWWPYHWLYHHSITWGGHCQP